MVEAVFLDRDGVIVVPEFREGRSFAPRTLENFSFYPDAHDCLTRLKRAGYVLVVVTNQPDVGNGLVPAEVVEIMHERLAEQLPVDSIKVCFHDSKMACQCRKPKPGMLLEAANELGIDLDRSIMVGDRASDVEAGSAVGCRTVFIDLGYSEPRPEKPTFVADSLSEAVNWILTHKPQS
jgi:D-glycero-D-manno-heptose 1,7-bisphosphate phosphatase